MAVIWERCKFLGAGAVILMFLIWVICASCVGACGQQATRESARSEIAAAVTDSLGCASGGRAEFDHARLDEAAKTSLAGPTHDTFAPRRRPSCSSG